MSSSSPAPAVPKRSEKRDEIVRMAGAAFCAHGFRGTAVDKVLADSGISKRTLYKYFRSKEELIAAVVKDYRDTTLSAVSAAIGRYKTPREKVLALFDMRKEILQAGDFTGCLATNARLEFRDEDELISAATAGFHRTLLDTLEALCRQAGCRDEGKLARQIMVLLIGTIVLGQSLHDAAIAADARQAALVILEQAETA